MMKIKKQGNPLAFLFLLCYIEEELLELQFFLHKGE